MKMLKLACLLITLCLCLAPLAMSAVAEEINPVLEGLTLGMSSDDALALDVGLAPTEDSTDEEKTLWCEMESWGTAGSLRLRFDANDALYSYTWSCQIGEPDCTLLDEAYRSDTAQEDSLALYDALCADMLALAGVEADGITPLSYSSDGGQYMMTNWTQEAPRRDCVWAANPLHYYFCRFTVSNE